MISIEELLELNRFYLSQHTKKLRKAANRKDNDTHGETPKEKDSQSEGT